MRASLPAAKSTTTRECILFYVSIEADEPGRHCFEFGVLSPGERPPCDYIPYYAGSGHTMGGNRTPNTPYVLDGTTEEEACSALSACAANAETTAAGLFDLHYLRDAAHWECVTYQGGGGGSEPPFDVDNEDVTQAYGYDGACQK